jgi:hypothetical protein
VENDRTIRSKTHVLLELLAEDNILTAKGKASAAARCNSWNGEGRIL